MRVLPADIDARPRWAALNSASAVLLALYAIAIPLSPQFDVLGIPDARPTDFILVIALLALVAERVMKHRDWRPPELLQPLLIIVLWDLFRVTVAPGYEFESRKQALGLYYLAKRLEYVLVLFAAHTVFSKPGRTALAVRLLMVGAVVFHLLILHEYHLHSGEEGFRASGFGTDQPNQAAVFIVGVCALAAVWMQRATERSFHVLCLVVIGTGTAALLATGSKEGLICAILAGCILAVWAKRWNLIVAALVVGALVWPLFPNTMRDRYTDIIDESQRTFEGVTIDPSLMPSDGSSSLADRVDMAQMYFKNVLPDCFWTGNGLGFLRLGIVDDFYLFEWVSNGLFGLLLFFWFLLIVWRLLQQALHSRDEVLLLLAQGLTCYLLALLFDGLACEVFYVVRPMELFFLLLGMISGRMAYLSATASTPLLAHTRQPADRRQSDKTRFRPPALPRNRS